MASKNSGLLGQFENFNWKESYASLILGAIIVIILGLLVANFFSKSSEDITETGDTSTETGEIGDTSTSQKYMVVAGDSLSKISEAHYGSQDFWPVIAQANDIVNPNLLYVDAEIELPSIAEAEEIKQMAAVTSYEVQEGDTLFIIAEKVYGDGYMWPRLDSANNVGRLPNGNPLIFAGSTITIPR